MNITELNNFKITDAINFHDELNPQLFLNDELRPEVRSQLQSIANAFREFIGVENIALIDITISGSNAAYTYTPHSDIDLHLVVDFDELSHDEVYKELFNAKKNDFNIKHDIKVRSYDVEVYVQDSNQPHTSLGEYSVAKGEWNRIPTKHRASLDDTATKDKYEKLHDLVIRALASNNEEYVNSIVDLIGRYRKAGLSEKGEFSPENLAFKVLRKNGLMQKLYDKKDNHYDASLSLESDNVLDEIVNEFNNFMEDGRIVKGSNTTADVSVDEIKIQAKKLGFNVSKDGVPPLLKTSGNLTESAITELNMSPGRLEKEVEKISKFATPIIGVELEVCKPYAEEDLPNLPITSATSLLDLEEFFMYNDEEDFEKLSAPYLEWLQKNGTKPSDTGSSFGDFVNANGYYDASSLYDDNESWLEWPAELDNTFNKNAADNTAAMMENDYNLQVLVGEIYHGGPRPDDTWVIEPDDSIRPNPSDSGMEIISPPMEYEDGIGTIQDIMAMLRDNDYYTNESTGMHINVSFDGIGFSGLDYIKLILLAGDSHILSQFGREINSYAHNSLNELSSYLAPHTSAKLGTSTSDKVVSLLGNMRTKFNNMIEHGLGNIDIGPHASISIKYNYIEFRAAGGVDYLYNDEAILNAINRFVVVYAAAADPEAYKKEYAKKLYKIASQHQPTSSARVNQHVMQMFAMYTSGNIDKYRLKDLLSQAGNDRSDIKDESTRDKLIQTLAIQNPNIEKDDIINMVDAAHKIEYTRTKNKQEAISVMTKQLMQDISFYHNMAEYEVQNYIHQIEENTQLNELDMSPGGLQKQVNSIMKTAMPVIGVEAEVSITSSMKEKDGIPDVNANTSIDDIIEWFDITIDDANRLMMPFNEWVDEQATEWMGDRITNCIDDPSDEEYTKCEILENTSLQDPDAIEALAVLTGDKDEEDISSDMASTIINNAHAYYKETKIKPSDWDYTITDPSAIIYYAVFVEEEPDELRDLYYDDFYQSVLHYDHDYSIGSYLTSLRIDTFVEIGNEFELRLPAGYGAEAEFDIGTAEYIAEVLEETLDVEVEVSDEYHTADRDNHKWILEPDPSITNDAGDPTMEVISPPMQYNTGVERIEQVFNLLLNHDGYTNNSTGLHINVSVNGVNFSDIDYVKLVLLLGDNYISEQFSRYNTQYAISSIDTLASLLTSTGLEKEYTSIGTVLAGMREKSSSAIQRILSRDINFGKYVTVGIKNNYIEFRSVGNSSYLENFDKIIDTINRFIVVYVVSADVNSHQKEYAKKLYKLAITSNGRHTNPLTKNAISLFAGFNSGKLSKNELKVQLRQLHKRRASFDSSKLSTKELINKYIKELSNYHKIDANVIAMGFHAVMDDIQNQTNKPLSAESLGSIFHNMKQDMFYYSDSK